MKSSWFIWLRFQNFYDQLTAMIWKKLSQGCLWSLFDHAAAASSAVAAAAAVAATAAAAAVAAAVAVSRLILSVRFQRQNLNRPKRKKRNERLRKWPILWTGVKRSRPLLQPRLERERVWARLRKPGQSLAHSRFGFGLIMPSCYYQKALTKLEGKKLAVFRSKNYIRGAKAWAQSRLAGQIFTARVRPGLTFQSWSSALHEKIGLVPTLLSH